jgi:sugar lactone lactonase YvrE
MEGGRITHRVQVSGYAIACALGGPEGRDLLISSTKTLTVAECRAQRLACIEHIKVDVPGAPIP